MKMRGMVIGQTIELEAPIGLPDGQQVEVEIRVPDKLVEPVAEKERASRRRYPKWEKLEARIATDPEFDDIREARQLREKLAKQWGDSLNLSLEYIREDRDR